MCQCRTWLSYHVLSINTLFVGRGSTAPQMNHVAFTCVVCCRLLRTSRSFPQRRVRVRLGLRRVFQLSRSCTTSDMWRFVATSVFLFFPSASFLTLNSGNVSARRSGTLRRYTGSVHYVSNKRPLFLRSVLVLLPSSLWHFHPLVNGRNFRLKAEVRFVVSIISYDGTNPWLDDFRTLPSTPLRCYWYRLCPQWRLFGYNNLASNYKIPSRVACLDILVSNLVHHCPHYHDLNWKDLCRARCANRIRNITSRFPSQQLELQPRKDVMLPKNSTLRNRSRCQWNSSRLKMSFCLVTEPPSTTQRCVEGASSTAWWHASQWTWKTPSGTMTRETVSVWLCRTLKATPSLQICSVKHRCPTSTLRTPASECHYMFLSLWCIIAPMCLLT